MPGLSPELQTFIDEHRSALATIKDDLAFMKRDGATREAVDQYKHAVETATKASKEEMQAVVRRISDVEVKQNRDARFGPSRTPRVDVAKSVFSNEQLLKQFKSKSSGSTSVSIEKLCPGMSIHDWCMRQSMFNNSPRGRMLQKTTTLMDPTGLVQLFQDQNLALLDRFYVPTLRARIPVINITTGDFRYPRRTKVHHLLALVATEASSGQADIILENAQGVKIGSVYTLSEDTGQEENITVSSVNLTTNTVTATANLGFTHPVGRHFNGDDFTFSQKCTIAPKLQILTDNVDDRVRNLRTTMDFAREDFDDTPRFEQELRLFLPNAMGRQFTVNVFYGNDTNEEFLGVFNDTDTQLIVWSTLTAPARREDAFGRAILLARLAQRRPEVLHITPSDIWEMRLTLDDNKRYLDKIIVDEQGRMQLWAIEVQDDDGLRPEDGLVATWSQGSRLYNRVNAAEIVVSTENTNNIETDKITLAVRERMGYVTTEPKAFVRVDLDDPPT